MISLCLKYNTVEFEDNLFDQKAFPWSGNVRRETEIGIMALELIRCAKDQFPKADKGRAKCVKTFPLEYIYGERDQTDVVMYVKFKHPEIDELNRFWANRFDN